MLIKLKYHTNITKTIKVALALLLTYSDHVFVTVNEPCINFRYSLCLGL